MKKADRNVDVDFMGIPYDEVECDCGTVFLAMSIDDEINYCVYCQNVHDGVIDGKSNCKNS